MDDVDHYIRDFERQRDKVLEQEEHERDPDYSLRFAKPRRPHRASRTEWAATKRVFSGFPCQVCGGSSSELHHILSRDGDGTWPRGDDYRSNLAALCSSCHHLITARDMSTRAQLRARFTHSQSDYLKRRIGSGRVDAYLARHYPEAA